MNTEKSQRDRLFENGSILLKNVISKELTQFFTHTLLRVNHVRNIENDIFQLKPYIDSYVPDAVSLQSNYFSDTLHESLWTVAEEVIGEKLSPTYSYSRLYYKGNVLPPHKDRPSCELSLSIQLGKSHDYSWPIYTEGIEYVLDEGDAMMYLGCDKTHWRNKCEGPEGYYSGQLFLHYVRVNGVYNHWAGDNRWSNKDNKEIPYIRNRVNQLKK